MEKFLEDALLYDFYGELLTEHQRQIYEDLVLNDLSLGEIAELRGISRQGVYDIIRRCRKQLQGYECKLRLIEKFANTREKVMQIRVCADEMLSVWKNQEMEASSCDVFAYASQMIELSDTILDEL